MQKFQPNQLNVFFYHHFNLTLFRMGYFEAAPGGRKCNLSPPPPPPPPHPPPPPPPPPHLPKSCHTYPIMMKLGTIISKFKKIQKIYKSGDTRLGIRIFSPGNRKSSYRKKYRYILHFGTKFPILVIFSECSQIFSINMVAILMMSAKMASLGLLKIKLF